MKVDVDGKTVFFIPLYCDEIIVTFWKNPWDIEILGWCTAGPSSDGVTIRMPYGVDVLHRPALHPVFSYWVV